MAEKRKGGLGRGLGSLIPTPETGRPADVFFPRSEREDAANSGGEADGGSPRRSSDPAESMRRAQAGRRASALRKTKAEEAAAASAPARGRGKTAEVASENEDAAKGDAEKSGKVSTRSAGKATGTGTRSSKASSTAAGKAAEKPARTAQSRKASGSAKQAGTASRSARGVKAAAQKAGDNVVEAADQLAPGSAISGSSEVEAAIAASEGAAAAPVENVTSAGEPGADDAAVSRGTENEQELVPVPGTTFGEIPVELIRPNPRQPRDVFDEDALEELVTSIREIGVLQPVVVRRRSDDPAKYELIMGERRFRASQEAGRTTVPAIVRETSDDDLLRDALLENLHRVDLNPLEEAAAYAQLLEDFACTQEELSGRIGRSRPQISNTLRLLKLPPMVQRRVAAGVLSSGHARAILGLNDAAQMEVLAQRVVAEGLSVRATEEAVVLLNRGEKQTVSRGTKEPDPALTELARSIGDRLETRVNVTMGKRKGKLSVEFADQADLKRILELLGISG